MLESTASATVMHCNCELPSGNQIKSPVEAILIVIGIGIIIYVLYRLLNPHSGVEYRLESSSIMRWLRRDFRVRSPHHKLVRATYPELNSMVRITLIDG